MIFAGRKFTYRELQEKVDSLAAALNALGVRKGEHVGLLLPNSPPFIIGYYAILKVGGMLSA